jgi:hypothetical protein
MKVPYSEAYEEHAPISQVIAGRASRILTGWSACQSSRRHSDEDRASNVSHR